MKTLKILALVFVSCIFQANGKKMLGGWGRGSKRQGGRREENKKEKGKRKELSLSLRLRESLTGVARCARAEASFGLEKENHCFRSSFREQFSYCHEVAAVLLRTSMQKAKG